MHPVLAINKVSGRWPVALKAAIAVAGPVFVAALMGDARVGLLTGLGAFTVLYGPYTAGRFRVRLMSVVAVAMILCTAVGALTHPWPWLNLASLVVIGIVAAITCGALKVGPPGSYFFVLVAGVAAYMTQHGQSPVRVVAMTALGGLVAVLVGLLDLVWAPRGAERTALAAAAAAMDEFEQAAADELPQARALASQSLHHAWTTVRDGVWGPQDRHIVGMLVALQQLQARYERRQAGLSGELAGFEVHPWGVAEGEEAPDESSFGDFTLEQLRDSSLGRPQPSYLLRGALSWPSPMLLVGLRVGVATALAGALALVIGVDHPYWAAAVAMLVLHQGGSRSSQTVRGVQRLLGTAAGLGLYWLVALWNPHGFWLAGLMFVLQFGIELLVVRNYALAVTFITPLALTIASAAAVIDPARVVGERALDTVLAVAVALATLWLVGRGTALLMARGQARRVLVAIDPVLGALAQGRIDTEQAAEDRRHLYFELLELQHVTHQSLVDQPDQVEPYRTMFTALGDLGYSVLGACWHPETYRIRRAAARASSAVGVIMAHPVTLHRLAPDLLAEVDAARSTLNDWS